MGLGICGLPIFQGYASGILHFAGPTGGYLVGFIAASLIVGSLMDRKRAKASFSYVVFSMLMGLIAIYAFGIAWLVGLYKISLAKAMVLGVLPFLPGAILKLMLASGIYWKIRARANEIIQK